MIWWRRNRERVWVTCLVLLWAWAMMILDQMGAAQVPQPAMAGTPTDGQLTPALYPTIICKNIRGLRNGEILRWSISHRGDRLESSHCEWRKR